MSQNTKRKQNEENVSPEGKMLASLKQLSIGDTGEGKVLALPKDPYKNPTKGRIPNMSKGLRKFAMLPVPTKCNGIWNSSYTGDIFLGHSTGGQIHVMSQDGELKGTVSLGSEFICFYSGIELSERRHLVTGHNGRNHDMRCVEFNVDMDALDANSKIGAHWPCYVFDYDDEKVGAFCQDPIRIELFRKLDLKIIKTLFLDIEVSSNTSQFDVCRSEDYICLNDCNGGIVHVLDNTGELVQTVGENTETNYLNSPGKLRWPRNIFFDVDGGLVITCRDGCFHRFISGKWEVVVKTKGPEDWLWHATVTDERVYTVFEDKLSMYKIRL